MSKKLRMFMLFYTLTFLLFVYFKIARVHAKDEKRSIVVTLQHFLVLLSFLSTYMYGFTNFTWYWIVLASLVFFIIAALLVTTLQLGIFIDGKPLLGMSKVYKFLPVLTVIIIALSAIIYL